MNKTQIQKLKSQLLAELKEVNTRINQQRATGKKLIAHEVGDSVDHALDSDTEVLEELTLHEANYIAKIENALERIKNGTYGICTSCRNAIPLPRLNAKPAVSLCLSCQEEHEQLKRKQF